MNKWIETFQISTLIILKLHIKYMQSHTIWNCLEYGVYRAVSRCAQQGISIALSREGFKRNNSQNVLHTK